MQRGFNSDISVRGNSYHIQSEDWGQTNPFIVSRIFCNGAVLKTVKTSYEKVFELSAMKVPDAIKLALQKQHATVIEELISNGGI